MNAFVLTLVFLISTTLIAGLLRRLRKDKCLRDFQGDTVTLEKTTGEIVTGRLKVEGTGLEFVFSESRNENELLTGSYLFYKYEFPQIQAIVRFHSQMSPEEKELRRNVLKRTYHPNVFRRTSRRFLSFFKTLRDSLIEIINLSVAHVQKSYAMAASLSNTEKYLKPVNTELAESVGTAYEPLLEQYIGHRVVFELIKGKQKKRYSGILKDYTATFIELIDVSYTLGDAFPPEKADLIVPQQFAIIRHLGEAPAVAFSFSSRKQNKKNETG